MFIYFDSNGVLKEIISDGAFRNGDSARDKIYIYVEGEPYITSAWIKFRLPNGNETIESCFFDRTTPIPQVAKQLPLEPKRNLKFFDYNHTYVSDGTNHLGYMFYEIEIPSSVLNSSLDDDEETPTSNNMVIGRARFVYPDSSIMSLGAITFSVESNIGILTDNSINETQYNYLLSKTDIGNPVVYTPYFVGTELHFSNNAGLPNPTPVNLKGDRGVSIDGFTKISTVGLIDTYRISLDDGTYYDLEVKNGKEVTSIELTSQTTSIATYTVTYNDGSTSTFEVTNSMDEAARYNLGAFDIVMKVNGITTITRQTGYLNIDKEKLTYYDSDNKQRWVICNLLGKTTVPSVNTEIGKIVSNNYETKTEANAWETNSGMSLNTSGDLVIYSTARPNGVIQYKLATSYQEQVIENQPLNTLDQNESQILKEEIEKSLNLSSNALSSYTLNQSGNLFLRGWVSPYVSQLFNQSASTSATSIEKTFTISTATKVRFQFGSDSGENTNFDQDLQAGTYTIKIATSVSNSVLTVSSIMLVECDHAYPYVPYNANKHITNAQAELLKDEYLKSSNLLKLEDKSLTTINGITYSISNGKITLNGTPSSSSGVVFTKNITNVLENGTYSFNFFSSASNLYCDFTIIKNGVTSWHTTTFTKDDNTTQVLFALKWTNTNTFTNATVSPMLVLGTTIPTTFEPYHGEIVHKKELNAVENKIVKLYAHDVRLKLSIVYNNFDFGDADTSFTYRVITRFATPFANIGSLITSASDGEILSISLLETENEAVLKAYPLSISLNDSDAGSWIVCMIDDTAKILSIDKNFSFISDTVTLLA